MYILYSKYSVKEVPVSYTLQATTGGGCDMTVYYQDGTTQQYSVTERIIQIFISALWIQIPDGYFSDFSATIELNN